MTRDRGPEVRANGFTDLVLVCTNDRAAEFDCCAEADGQAVYEAVTTWLRDRGVFWSHVYVAESSCLGLCSANGTAITIQPRDRWYSDVRPGEVPALLAAEFGDDASTLGAERGASEGIPTQADTE